jgi:hypothetical protein
MPGSGQATVNGRQRRGARRATSNPDSARTALNRSHGPLRADTEDAMRRLIATLALLAAAGASHAGSTGRLVDVRLYDATEQRELPLYRDGGRVFVPGTPGNRYRVVLENRTPERLLAVLSVDGVNAVTGQTAAPAQSGYVLGPWERAEIRGWRKSLQESAEFYFTELPDSYAARTGRPDDVGVVGVAVFRERTFHRPPIAQEAPAPWRGRDGAKAESEARSADGLAGSAKQHAPAAPAQELGTGHGERRWDPVGSTQFERRSSRPEEVVALYYDSVPVLIARGVMPPPRRHPRDRRPDPFPMGFVPDPRR